MNVHYENKGSRWLTLDVFGRVIVEEESAGAEYN